MSIPDYYKPFLVAIGALFLAFGCNTTTVDPGLPCPPRPILESFTVDELRQMGVEVQEKVATNQIRLKEYAKKLESRAQCDNDSL